MGFFGNLFGGNKNRGEGTPGQGKGGGRFKQIFEMAKPQLNLRAEQEQQISSIFREFRGERQDLKQTGGDAMQQGIRDARNEAKDKIMAVLNDEQKKVLEENFQKWKQQTGT